MHFNTDFSCTLTVNLIVTYPVYGNIFNRVVDGNEIKKINKYKKIYKILKLIKIKFLSNVGYVN